MQVLVENPRIDIRICKKLPQFTAFCIIVEHSKTNITEETRILWCQTVIVGYPPASYKTQVFSMQAKHTTNISMFHSEVGMASTNISMVTLNRYYVHCVFTIPGLQPFPNPSACSVSIPADICHWCHCLSCGTLRPVELTQCTTTTKNESGIFCPASGHLGHKR